MKDHAVKAYLQLAIPGALIVFFIALIVEYFSKHNLGSFWILGFSGIQIISVFIPLFTRRDQSKIDVMKIFIASLVVRIVLLPFFLIIPVSFGQVELILFMISLAFAYTILQTIEIKWLFKFIGKQGEISDNNNSNIR